MKNRCRSFDWNGLLDEKPRRWGKPVMRLTLLFTVAISMGLFGPVVEVRGDQKNYDAFSQPTTIAFSMTDLDGTVHKIGENGGRRVRVYVFVSTECPISNRYISTLNELYARTAVSGKAVEFFGVVSDFSVTRAQALQHFSEYKAEFPILFDASGLLAQALKPSHVPQAFVFDRDGKTVYRGAIDNSWEGIGRRRPKADQRFLGDAISSALNGQQVAIAVTKPVGCLFETPLADDRTSKVTYARDIAPIIQARCLNCHREGQTAPFQLGDYDQAARRATQIVRVTQDRLMPPWMPSHGHHKFVAERRLSDQERKLLQTWTTTGLARGDDADLPPAPKSVTGWRGGPPDLIVKMAEPFLVHAGGPDLHQNFVIPVNVAEDKLVAGIEIHPGNHRVAQHAVLFLDDSGSSRTLDQATPEPGYASFGGLGFLPSGVLGGWTADGTPQPLPNGMGRYLKKDTNLVLQMQYHPAAKAESDQSEIGLYFVRNPIAEASNEPPRSVGCICVANQKMDIPAGDKVYRRTTSYKLPKDVFVVGVVPRMHMLGKSMTVTATLPDQTVKTLLEIEKWNNKWHDEYYYERPFKLVSGTGLNVESICDNSVDHPINRNSPPKRVTSGEGTNDETTFCLFLISAEKIEDLFHVIDDNLKHGGKQP